MGEPEKVMELINFEACCAERENLALAYTVCIDWSIVGETKKRKRERKTFLILKRNFFLASAHVTNDRERFVISSP